MAGFVNGKYIGIAPEATVVGVKVASDEGVKTDWIHEGFRWATADVISKGRQGKAVFVSAVTDDPLQARRNNVHTPQAYGPPYNIPRPFYADAYVPNLAEAWDAGVVTVFCAGNAYNPTDPTANLYTVNIGSSTPQRFATPNNALIIVGSIDGNGIPSTFNLLPGPYSRIALDQRIVGEITVYAQGELVARPVAGNMWRPASGTSLAAPQVGGLAAYLLGLPGIQKPNDLRTIGMAMKTKIRNTARDGRADGAGVVHNGIWELTCGTQETIPKVRREVKEAMTMDTLEYGLGVNMTVHGTEIF